MKKLLLSLALMLASVGCFAQTTVTFNATSLAPFKCYSGVCTNVPNSQGSAVSTSYYPPINGYDGSVSLTFNGQVYSAPLKAADVVRTPGYLSHTDAFANKTLYHASGATIRLSLTMYQHDATCSGRGSGSSCMVWKLYGGNFSY